MSYKSLLRSIRRLKDFDIRQSYNNAYNVLDNLARFLERCQNGENDDCVSQDQLKHLKQAFDDMIYGQVHGDASYAESHDGNCFDYLKWQNARDDSDADSDACSVSSWDSIVFWNKDDNDEEVSLKLLALDCIDRFGSLVDSDTDSPKADSPKADTMSVDRERDSVRDSDRAIVAE